MSPPSYFAGSLVPIRIILVGSVGSISAALVSSVGWNALEEVGPLQSGTTGIAKFLSSGSSVELTTAVVSS